MADRDKQDRDDKRDSDEEPDRDIDAYLISDDKAQRNIGYAMAFVRYGWRIYAYIRATYWYCLSEADVTDICAASFYGFLNKVEKKRFTPTGDVRPLLFTIALNQARELLRRRGQHHECRDAFVDDRGSFDVPLYEQRELQEAILDAVISKNILPPWERLVFTYWLDLVYENGGHPPSLGDLTDRLYGPITEKVFGTKLSDEDPDEREKLTDGVKHARDRALKKVWDHLMRIRSRH